MLTRDSVVRIQSFGDPFTTDSVVLEQVFDYVHI